MARHAWLAICVAVGLGAALLAAPPNQPQVPFRAGVVLVPLDVRVVDRDGNPVTDLTAADFTITEDRVPQQIAHFATRSLTSATVAPPADLTNPLAADAVSPRTFVIVLGRGLLNGPVKSLDALIDFVNTRLLAQDRVGVIAYLRASELTTNHRVIAQFLERYRDRYARIEDALGFNRPSAFKVKFDQRWLSQDARTGIDALFDSPELPRFEDLPGAAGGYKQAFFHGTDLNLAIEYVRQINGEKHLIFVSERPLRTYFRYVDADKDLWVRRATGARVALHLIHTGGVATSAQPIRRNGDVVPPMLVRADDPEVFAPADLRRLAQHTGGTSAYYQQADKPLAQLDRITRFQYLIGYYPTASAPDDQHRVIAVTVKRDNVTTFYRHGYQVRAQPGTPEDFRRSYSTTRMAAVADYLKRPQPRPPGFPRSPIRANAKVVSVGEDTEVQVEIKFDAAPFTFIQDDDAYTTSVDVAVYVDAADGTLLAEKRDQIELKVKAADLKRLKREWLAYDVKLKVKGRPAYVRAVVYEYESNRLLSARDPVRRR